MNDQGYRATVCLAFGCTVLLPFLWAYNFSVQFGLDTKMVLYAYRPELIAVVPCAILLVAAWRMRRWAAPGLCIAAAGMPLLKWSLGGAPTDAWKIDGFLFVCLALRLWFIRRAERTRLRVCTGQETCATEPPST